MPEQIQRRTDLVAHAIQFVRYFRTKGYNLGPKETSDLLQVLSHHIPKTFEEQQHIFKAVLAKNRKQYLQFDSLYEDYWRQLERAEDSKIKDVEEEQPKTVRKNPQNSLQALKNWLYNGSQQEDLETAAYSALEAVGKKDFSAFHTDEYLDFLEIIKIISKKLANKKSRRFIKSRSRKYLDLKRTINQSLRKGGAIDSFHFKERQIKKTNLILLCDVSRSMELYSKFLIEFIYGFQQSSLHIRSFVFSTRLMPLDREYSGESFEEMLRRLSEQVPYWSGGTRIGESFSQFKEAYAGKLLNKRSILIILSDGWDTGETEDLEETMRFFHKKANRVIWLNPLAGNPDYQPETKAMKAALPYIDIFTSAHNLESLQDLAKYVHLQKYKTNNLKIF